MMSTNAAATARRSFWNAPSRSIISSPRHFTGLSSYGYGRKRFRPRPRHIFAPPNDTSCIVTTCVPQSSFGYQQRHIRPLHHSSNTGSLRVNPCMLGPVHNFVCGLSSSAQPDERTAVNSSSSTPIITCNTDAVNLHDIHKPFVPDLTQTLEENHLARQAHAQAVAQFHAHKRQQAHEQQVQTAQQLAEQRRRERLIKAKRMNVAKLAVPYLLSTRADLFGTVMAELNLSSTEEHEEMLGVSNQRDEEEEDEGPSAQYRSLYLDSIPSFVEKLVNHPEAINVPIPNVNSDDEDAMKEIEPVNILLDELANASWDDPNFTKRHRQNARRKAEHLAYMRQVREHIRRMEQRKAKLMALEESWEKSKEDCREVEEELKRLEEEMKAQAKLHEEEEKKKQAEEKQDAAKEGNDPTENQEKWTSVLSELSPASISKNIQSVLGLLKPISEEPPSDTSTVDKDPIYPDEEDNEEEQGSSSSLVGVEGVRAQVQLRRRLRKLTRRSEKAERMTTQARNSFEGAERQLNKLKSEKGKYANVLSNEEYNRAAEVGGEVLRHLCAPLARHIHDRHQHLIERYRILDAKTDLTKPHEWYPYARLSRRKIIYHGGPTNSGKTYTALQRLKEADRGLYLGPLRLLAAEIYEQLNSEGVYTNLFTGQEKKEVAFSTHSAATVELAPLDRDFDVVVIDEIQMISDLNRGWAWTRALLGLRCNEIHVAGGLEAKELVERLATACGDEFELSTYDRFSELEISDTSLAKNSNEKECYKAVEPGDCVVAFSRNDIFAIKREIEKNTKYKCCVIYGSLPPSTRSEQARLFNDPDSGYDILVASDAIGMGLNLSIKRIIFNSMFKSTGDGIVQLDHSAVKQISGRAGRRNSPYPVGEVTVRDPVDLDHLQRCMRTDIRSIGKAGLLPTSSHFSLFATATKEYNDMGEEEEIDINDLHSVLLQFEELARLKGDFKLCKLSDMRVIAKNLGDLPLLLKDKYSFCMAPVQRNCNYSMRILRRFAEKYSRLETPGFANRDYLTQKPKSLEELSILCARYNRLELFLWLSQKFPSTSNIIEQNSAAKIKDQCLTVINDSLSIANRLSLDHCYIRRDKNIRAMYEKERKGGGEDEEYEVFVHELDQYDDLLKQFEVEDI